MREKVIFLETLRYIGYNGQPIELDKQTALLLQGSSVFDIQCPFTLIVEGDGSLPFMAKMSFGRVPKGFASLLQMKPIFVNKCKVVVCGNKLPDVYMEILIEK